MMQAGDRKQGINKYWPYGDSIGGTKLTTQHKMTFIHTAVYDL